ncbi:MAG: prepilin-type N-terminal cleavage/methylation domain-containing protein [Geobacteraceae bacterium]|nr:prepilin-type N-terminal cleavage/methylation domain-containing protein [Geobacteraceae bacterium]
MVTEKTLGLPAYPALGASANDSGFTLVELLTILAVTGIIAALAISAFSSTYSDVCLKSVMCDLGCMINEAKQNALDGRYYAIGFRPDHGTIMLITEKGADGKWNTSDDEVKRTVRLKDKGGGLGFGYGGCGPVPELAATKSGTTFQNNTLVCNPQLTGSPGTVYIRSGNGSAMALTMNTHDFDYSLRICKGKSWTELKNASFRVGQILTQ